MMNKKILLFVLAVVWLSSCKKNYKCSCTNENGTYEAGEIEGTKRQAKKQCASLGSGATTCEIK